MDPHQLYQIDPTSLATSPVFPTSSPIDESPMAQTPQEQRVPTLAQIIEMKETLQKVLTKVEMLEQRKPAQRSNDAIGTNATDDRISLLTGQMERMAGEQAAYLASIQQGMIGILSAQQHATAERTKMAESSRYVTLVPYAADLEVRH